MPTIAFAFAFIFMFGIFYIGYSGLNLLINNATAQVSHYKEVTLPILKKNCLEKTHQEFYQLIGREENNIWVVKCGIDQNQQKISITI